MLDSIGIDEKNRYWSLVCDSQLLITLLTLLLLDLLTQGVRQLVINNVNFTLLLLLLDLLKVCVGRYSRRFIEKMAGDFWSKGTRHIRSPLRLIYARVHGPAVCMRAGVIGCEEITLPKMKLPSFHSASSQV